MFLEFGIGFVWVAFFLVSFPCGLYIILLVFFYIYILLCTYRSPVVWYIFIMGVGSWNLGALYSEIAPRKRKQKWKHSIEVNLYVHILYILILDLKLHIFNLVKLWLPSIQNWPCTWATQAKSTYISRGKLLLRSTDPIWYLLLGIGFHLGISRHLRYLTDDSFSAQVPELFRGARRLSVIYLDGSDPWVCYTTHEP